MQKRCGLPISQCVLLKSLKLIKSLQREQCGWTLSWRVSANDSVYGFFDLYFSQSLFQQNQFVIITRNIYKYFREISVSLSIHAKLQIDYACLWEKSLTSTASYFLPLNIPCSLSLGWTG